MMQSRRSFLKTAAAASTAFAVPLIIPSRLLGADAPSNRIRVAQIGCGRIAFGMDIPGVMKTGVADFVAVADYDRRRADYGKQYIEKNRKGGGDEIKVYGDYKEILERKDIDAVVISTPDHQHAEPAARAARAGKDIWLQKPLAMCVAESRACYDTVAKTKQILMIGSQQRSSDQFRKACEYVRSGRIGRIKQIEIGLPKDETKADDPEQPVPANLNYDAWLGPVPMSYYTEQRVHSQKLDKKGNPDVDSRPGWLRNEDTTLGMITGWGSHHYDIAHWGMGIVEGGPETVEGEADFPSVKIWNVHQAYRLQYTYPGGIVMKVSNTYPNGVRFIGDDGWIFVSRGAQKATASDPTAGQKPLKALDASDPKLIAGAPTVELYKSTNHHKNWTDCLKSRQEPITPCGNGHYVFTACSIGWVAMKLKRPLKWDAKAEKFVGDDEANALLKRAERPGYGIFNYLKSTGA